MPSALDPTVGGVAANTYETYAEANAYFADRISLAPPWVTSGNEVYLLTATRVLDALAQPFKTFVPGTPPYYRVRRQWTGAPATLTQRLAWPRVGMFDQNGNPLDYAIMAVSVASPTKITTNVPHHLVTGQKVLLANSNSTPAVDGERAVTVTSATEFTVAVNVTVAGMTGNIYVIPQALKDAESELAGQLLKGDRTLDNDVIVQGLNSVKAGSVALGFNKSIVPQVIPDAVYNLMPVSWLTEEVYQPANPAFIDVGSRASDPSLNGWRW